MNSKIKKGIFGLFFLIFIILVLFSLIIYFYFLNKAIFLIFLLIFYFINLMFLIEVWLKNRSDYYSRISWTVVLLLIPGGGSLIYYFSAFTPFFIESRMINEKREVKVDKNYLKEFNNLNNQFKINYKKQGKKIIFNSKIDFLQNGNKKFQNLLEDIKKATKTIYIQYFIINNGIIWKNIEELLIKKRNEGVEIKILVDYIGNIQTKNSTFDEIIKNKIEFVFFNKTSFLLKNGSLNYRSHNKFFLIDKKICYFGGMNIGDDYSGLYPKYGFWFDLQIRTEGEIVIEFYNHFVEQWNIYSKNKLNFIEEKNYQKNNFDQKNINTRNIQFFDDGPLYNKTYFLNNLINLIKNSKKEIKLVSAYFVVPQILLNELQKAVKRGVKVKLITSGRADKKSAYFVGEFFISDLISRGIKVYRVNNTFIHSKFYLFDDDLLIFGTSNLDYRSIYMHFESNLLIQDTKKVLELSEIFFFYLSKSYLEKPKHNTKKLCYKIKYFFIKLISPIF